jgi:hypothetical protein
MGYPSEASMKFGRNSTTEKSPIRRLPSRGNTSPFPNFLTAVWVALYQAHSPDCGLRHALVFLVVVSASLCAAPATHQAQGSLTSRSRARRQPLARSVPQKTFGSLPCPIVYSVQKAWLPRGSNFSRAHGRGVARLSNPGAGPLSRAETGTHQNGWL